MIPRLAPPEAPGWTHIWDYREQLAISDEVAAVLVYLDIIRYSGDYRVYKPVGSWTCERIRGNLV
jgi:hypothetical protein